MRTHDSTQTVVVCCHDLTRHARQRYIRADSWKSALDALWPFPYGVVLRLPGEERAFQAVCYMCDREAFAVQHGDTPEEAIAALRREWERCVQEDPAEIPDRLLRPARRLLESRGIEIRDHWDDLMRDIGTCDTYGQACEVMSSFLHRNVPWLNERDRFRVMLRLEDLPFAAMRQAVGA
ncbi:MAG: hypothetical protein ACOC1T_02205 [Halorhodospira sp.]